MKPIVFEPVTVITGNQGAGKTLFAIQQADLLVQSGAAKRVFQLNIPGANESLLPEPPYRLDRWHEEAENGDVIIIDEVYKAFPQRGYGKPPAWIEAIAQARLRGVRFLLLTQAGDFDHFVKERINRHFHIERKGGLKRATIYEFENRFEERAKKDSRVREDAVKHLWRFPKEYFDWYKSAEEHYFKLRIPWKLWLVPLFVIAAGIVAWQVVAKVGGLADGIMPSQGIAASSSVGPSQSGKRELPPITTADEYQKRFAPLVPGLPWTAPAFADRPVTTTPDLYCVGQGEAREGKCTCYSEQVTPVNVDFYQCWDYAEHGVYNPFRASSGGSREGATGAAREPRPGPMRAGP